MAFRKTFRAASAAVLLLCVLGAAAAQAEPVTGKPYRLELLPREDSTRTDPETGAALLFLTNGKEKDGNLYFHQRSWLADGSVILFSSQREKGGLMGYVAATGELARITASDGAPVNRPTAAVNRNSVFAMSGDRCLEIALSVEVKTRRGVPRAVVTAVERQLCVLPGVDVYLNESCDARYLAAGGAAMANGKPGIMLVDEADGSTRLACALPEGLAYGGHVQWSTTNPNWISFAGRPERLWMVDIREGKPFCPYVQRPGELVTHESWWVNDQLMFCGGVHAAPHEDSHVKLLDPRTGVVRIIGEGAWWPGATPEELAKRNWWHASGSPDGCWAAGDNWHGDIMLFEGPAARPRLLTTGHRTYGRGAHPEVGWDRRGEQVIFNSHMLGEPAVCVATIPETWRNEVRAMGGRVETPPPVPEGQTPKGDRGLME